MDKEQPISVNQPKRTGIVLNRMYTGSYLSSNLGHEVINMFQADNNKHYLYLNSTGDFSQDHVNKIGSMLLIKYAGQDEAGSAWVEVVGCAMGLNDVYRRDEFGKTIKQDGEYLVDSETKMKYIKYGGVEINTIFKGSDQQDVLISFQAGALKKPEACKIFLRFKPNVKKSLVYFGISDISENVPNEYEDSIKMSPGKFLWKAKDKNGTNAYLFDEKPVYVIELDANFGSTSLKNYFNEGTQDYVKLAALIECDKIWTTSSEKLSNNNNTSKRAVSIFNVCQIENSENSISNALAFFMDKYRAECCDFFKERGIGLSDNFKISREVDSKIDGENNLTEDSRSSKGRIDLLIEDDTNIIIIENKIKSDINGVKGDCDGKQLKRYHTYANWKKCENVIEDIKQSLKGNLINGASCTVTLINGNEIRIDEPKNTQNNGKKRNLKFRNNDKGEDIRAYLDTLQQNFKNSDKKKVYLFVLSPNYNKPHIQEYKKDDIGNEEWKPLTYKDIYNYIGSFDIKRDKNLRDFYNVIERHTADNLCDWLKEDMKNTFITRINNFRKSANNA